MIIYDGTIAVDKQLYKDYAIIIMSQFGNRIREARRARGLSLRAAAEMFEISFTYLSKIEAGDMDPPAEDKIRIICQKLELNEDELFSLAQKVPAEWAQATFQTHVPQILRMVSNLSEDERLKLLQRLEKNKS